MHVCIADAAVAQVAALQLLLLLMMMMMQTSVR